MQLRIEAHKCGGKGVALKAIKLDWPVLVAVLALASTWLFLAWLGRDEPAPASGRLASFPLDIGHKWYGYQRELPARERELLRATEVMLRDYHPLDAGQGPRAPIVLYVGYYHSQRTGATYHSPQHCLPGGGWQIAELNRLALPGPHERVVQINEVIVQKGLDKQLILYWYQDRGRIIASEYWARGYMIWDALTKNRSDGALVRVSLDVGRDLQVARKYAREFVSDIWAPLSDVLPGAEWTAAAPDRAAMALSSEHGREAH